MNQILFVTGTDTSVGKTVFTAWLIHDLQRRGIRARAIKPVCTGGTSDVRVLRRFQPDLPPGLPICFWSSPRPIAPGMAGIGKSQAPDLKEIKRKIEAASEGLDLLVVEGVGGLMAPMGPDYLVIDLIEALKQPHVILVSRNKLGTLNHTFLSAFLLRERKIKNFSVVLMEPRVRDASASRNQKALEKWGDFHVFPFPFLGRFPVSNRSQKNNYKKIKKSLAPLWNSDTFTTLSVTESKAKTETN